MTEDTTTFVTSEDIAGMLRDARKRRGWTTARLAYEAGVSQPMVTLCETGKRVPHTPKLIDLLGALGYDLQAVKRP